MLSKDVYLCNGEQISDIFSFLQIDFIQIF